MEAHLTRKISRTAFSSEQTVENTRSETWNEQAALCTSMSHVLTHNQHKQTLRPIHEDDGVKHMNTETHEWGLSRVLQTGLAIGDVSHQCLTNYLPRSKREKELKCSGPKMEPRRPPKVRFKPNIGRQCGRTWPHSYLH